MGRTKGKMLPGAALQQISAGSLKLQRTGRQHKDRQVLYFSEKIKHWPAISCKGRRSNRLQREPRIYKFGGLLINDHSQVTDLAGNPVKGLCTAGESLGGFYCASAATGPSRRS